MKNKLLLVEDNEIIIKGLRYTLEQENFELDIVKSKEDAEDALSIKEYDLVILDIMLPDGNGFDLCKYIKKEKEYPVIFLTAKDEEKDVVLGFDLGADDYIIKPFRNRELISRIQNVLRRYNKNKKELICKNIKVDLDSKRVYVNDQEVIFTALEYRILVLLLQNKGKTITREKILDKIWDIAGSFVNDNTLTVYIKRVRAKLGTEDVIKTIKGIGYRVE